jgi:hypothetical protein
MSYFMLAEPLVPGRIVLHAGDATGGPGPELLRRAGAADVLACGAETYPWPVPDGCADIVMAELGGALVCDDPAWRAWLDEARRVVRADGFCMLRIAAVARAGASLRTALADLLLEHFAVVDIVEETPFSGVSFFVPGTEELAVNEGLASLAGKPAHMVALCGWGPERSWSLAESLLVPTDVGADESRPSAGELAAWRAEAARLQVLCEEVGRERDGVRELNMVLQDRVERLERTVGALRRDIERYLRQIGDGSTARELLAVERDGLQRRIEASARQMEEAGRELDRRQSAIRALEKEVARLRAARGGSGR